MEAIMKEWKFLLIYILMITILFLIFVFYCAEFGYSNSVEYSDKIYNDKEIMAMVTERITYERENLRYYEEQKEFEHMMEQFHEREASLNILVHSITTKDRIGVIFNNKDNTSATAYHTNAGGIRHLIVMEDGTPSFRYSDLKTYLDVITDKEILGALYDVNKGMYFMNHNKIWVVFQLDGLYFNERDKIEYIYYGDTNDIDYLRHGYRVAQGWTIDIVEYDENYDLYPQSFTCTRIMNDNYPFYGGIYMKKIKIKVTIIIAILYTIIICIAFLWWFNIHKKQEKADFEKKISDRIWESEKLSIHRNFDFLAIQDRYWAQTEEYQRVLNIFYRNKETFEQIINETNQSERKNGIGFYLLGENWREQLNYLPDNELLRAYGEYFFTYTWDVSNRQITDFELNEQVMQNKELEQILNNLSKKGEVMELYFSEEGVWIKLIGPFFKEKVMATVGYIYNGKADPYTEKCPSEMWIDDNWLLYVPYTAQIDGYTPDYKRDLPTDSY